MVPVMKGRGFFSKMSSNALPYRPRRHSSMYSGMSCPMGQPPLQGAVKQSMRGTLAASFRLGRCLAALTWWGSVRADRERAATLLVLMAMKGSNLNWSSFSAIWRNRW